MARTRNALKYRWVVFGLLAVGYFLVFFHRLSPAVVALDLMRDLDADGGLVGLLASMYFYPYALMQIPSGLLSDSWGPRKTVTTFFLLAGAGAIVFGLAESIAVALGARLLVGMGVGMLFVPTIKVLTRWFRASEFSGMTGLLVAMGGVGALSAASPLAWFAETMGWRGSFLAMGAATIVLAVAVWLLVRDTPQDMGMEPVEPLAEAGDPGRGGTSPQRIPLLAGMSMVLGSWRFWPVGLWFFFTVFIYFSFIGLWGGPFFMESCGLTRAETGSVLSMCAVGLILGGPLSSVLSDRILRSRKRLLLGSSALLLVLVLPMARAPFSLGPVPVHLWAMLLGMCSNSVVGVTFSLSKELFPVEIAGTVTGLVNLFPFLGGAIGQLVLGLLLDAQGRGAAGYSPQAYAHAFRLYVGAAALALLCALLFKETLGPAKDPATQRS